MEVRFAWFSLAMMALMLNSVKCEASGKVMSDMNAKTYDQLQQALMTGKRVSALFDFSHCKTSGVADESGQAGLDIRAFMIHDHQISFSDMHPTVLPTSNVIDEFIRYVVKPDGKVNIQSYTMSPGQEQAVPVARLTCRLGNGATFAW